MIRLDVRFFDDYLIELENHFTNPIDNFTFCHFVNLTVSLLFLPRFSAETVIVTWFLVISNLFFTPVKPKISQQKFVEFLGKFEMVISPIKTP